MTTYPERNKRIYAERKAGLKFKEIGERYHLTTERVRQIYLREERIRLRSEIAHRYGGRSYTKLSVDNMELDVRILKLDIRRRKFDSQLEDYENIEKLNNLIEVYKEV